MMGGIQNQRQMHVRRDIVADEIIPLKRITVKKMDFPWNKNTSDKMIAITTDSDEPIIVLGFKAHSGVLLPRAKELHGKTYQETR